MPITKRLNYSTKQQHGLTWCTAFSETQASQKTHELHTRNHPSTCNNGNASSNNFLFHGLQLCLHIQKECFKEQHVNCTHYNIVQTPYTIIKQCGNNAFKLDFPPYLSLHPTFNVELSQFHSPLLE